MAKTTSTAPKGSSTPKGGKKGGKKGKMPLGQRVVIGAAVLGLAWYLYTKQKAKKLAEEQKKLIGGNSGAYGTGGAYGPGGVGGEYTDPNTGLPCSQVFGGCPKFSMLLIPHAGFTLNGVLTVFPYDWVICMAPRPRSALTCFCALLHYLVIVTRK